MHLNCSCTTVSKSPIARFESAVAVAQKQMFIIGGHIETDLIAVKSVTKYDPVTDQWNYCKEAPIAISHVTACVVDDRYIWIVGGYMGQHPGKGIAESYRYDAVTDEWDDGPPVPEIRASGGCALIGRTLHYFGGIGADRVTNFDDHWILDVDNPIKWERLSPIPFARTHSATCTLENQIYAIGGHFGHDDPNQPGIVAATADLDYVHRYCPISDKWEEVAPLPKRRSHCEPGTFAYDGKIICIGGRNNSPNARSRYEKSLIAHYAKRALGKGRRILGLDETPGPGLDDIIAYDPVKDQWLDIGTIPERLYAPAAAVVDDKIIVTNGGKKGWQDPSASTYNVKIS